MNQGFEILRSKNGQDWEILDFVEGHGTIENVQEYQYYDRFPLSGDNYYRLKQIDFGGKYQFSDVQHIRIEGKGIGSIEVYPNPTPSTSKYAFIILIIVVLYLNSLIALGQ